MAETRPEIEARLEAASQSMSRRIAAVEDEVRLPAVVRLKDAVSTGRARKIGMAVGFGLVVGLIASRLSRSGSDQVEKKPPASTGNGPIGFLVGYAAREAGTALAKELVKRFAARRNGNS
jgi:hypothetical protein